MQHSFVAPSGEQELTQIGL